MNTHANKSKENESHSMPNAVTQKQRDSKFTFQFVDNRTKVFTHQNLQKRANNNALGGVIQRVSIEEDIDALKKVKQVSNDPLLTKILTEVLNTLGKKTTTSKHGFSAQTSHMGPEGKHGVDRKHEIVIDPTHYPEDKFRQSILVHETIHASADNKYAFNAKENESAFNVVHSDIIGKSGIEQYKNQVPVLLEILYSLKNKVDRDKEKLGDALAEHIIARIDRAIAAPMQEFDTVISELYYYLRVKHENINSGVFFHELQRSTNAAYNARNKGKNIRESYKSELPRLNIQKKQREYQEKIQLYQYLPKNTVLLNKFNHTKAQAVTDLGLTNESNLKKIYEKYLMKLMQIQLESYGNQAETIANTNDLNTKRTQLTYLDWRMDLRTIKSWRFTAKQKLAKTWLFTGAMTTAIAGLDTIITAFNPLVDLHHNFENYTPEDL